MLNPIKLVLADPGFCTRVGLMQVRYALWVNLTEVSVGMAYGFAAVSLPYIASPEDIMKVTMHEGNWIATVLSMVAPIGCLMMGLVMDRYGRRPAMLLCKVPLCIGWLYTGFAPSSIHVIVGVVITGMGCGMAISPPRVYIAEASLPNMRGTLSAFTPLASSIGIAIQACLAWLFPWKIVCFITAFYTAGLIVLDYFLPETPYFLLTQTDTSVEVEQTLKRLRGDEYDMQQELEEIIDFKTTNKISKMTIYGTLQAILTLSAWKPFGIIAGYMFIEQISGASIMIVWTVEILAGSRSTVNPNVGNAMMSATRFCTAIVLTGLLYKLSRRFLALTSSVGVGVACFQIFLFLEFSAKRHVFPQICYIFYVLFATLGYNSLPFMYMSELFPLQVEYEVFKGRIP
ncbi:facilitated trehalose transporter Tret1-like [Choristoneura fumiferana]|uniref:facilitated trehalose transporter Tret1-like n=1 Tax=Choristoneura fumiferana TaxID=7141 RepID=UPI003D15584A